VSDPPSFAANEASVRRGVAAYRKLHRACAEVLAPGGVFCACSCSSHVDLETFASTLDDRSLGRDDLRLTGLFGQPADHPTLPAWPEGRYLKMATVE
jgi:23S rRNA (cytosine1962-C5)-methyltransferase